MTELAVEKKRLQWLCTHRSMREMDVILGNFLEQHYPSLPQPLAMAFAELAELEDIELWPLITGKKTVSNTQQLEILGMLRHARVK